MSAIIEIKVSDLAETRKLPQGIQATLISSENGFDDYNVEGMSCVHRVCIGHGIKKGEIFNVYCSDSVKLAGTWQGTLEKSLDHLKSHPDLIEQQGDRKVDINPTSQLPTVLGGLESIECINDLKAYCARMDALFLNQEISMHDNDWLAFNQAVEAKMLSFNQQETKRKMSGSIGKHDWCIGKHCENEHLVYVDDRPISYRPTIEAAQNLALDVINRCIADGDYRLNDKPQGFMPPVTERKLPEEYFVVDASNNNVVSGPFESTGEIPLRFMGYDGKHKVLTGAELDAVKGRKLVEDDDRYHEITFEKVAVGNQFYDSESGEVWKKQSPTEAEMVTGGDHGLESTLDKFPVDHIVTVSKDHDRKLVVEAQIRQAIPETDGPTGVAFRDALESILLALRENDVSEAAINASITTVLDAYGNNYLTDVSFILDLNILDDEGNVVDVTQTTMTINQIQDVVDHASQAILVRRDRGNVDAALDELEEALVVADVIQEASINR